MVIMETTFSHMMIIVTAHPLLTLMKIMVTTALFSHMTVMVAPFTQMAIMVTSAPYIRPLLTDDHHGRSALFTYR
jgi:hypothetical protein